MPPSSAPPATSVPAARPPAASLLRRYTDRGTVLSCEPVAQGLLNRGYRLDTTHGRYFLKHHLDSETACLEVIGRQHRATRALADLGVPVAPPLTGTDGRTVQLVDGRPYALHPWIDGRHRHGAQLTVAQSRSLGALLGLVHRALAEAMDDSHEVSEHISADPGDTFSAIDRLLCLVRSAPRPADAFDVLAEHRLVERRALLHEHAHHRPPPGAATTWVHGDFHPLNLLYGPGTEPLAIVDWDRLGVHPRAEEAVRAAAIFFLRPSGALDLRKVRAYARAYRRAAGADCAELAAAVHRVWWERLNDFWILAWRYQRNDRRADAQFPAASALVVWWTKEYDQVVSAFAG